MSIELFSLLMFGAFFLLMALGVPLAFVLFSLAIVFGYILQGSSILPWIILRTWGLMNLSSFIAIPLFVFMANMLQHSGVADDLFNALHKWMGPLRGGLAVSAVLAATILAAMVGTAGAGVVLMGLIALPFMLRAGYDRRLACGSILAGGSLGQLIPPSVLFIIYGLFAGESIGKLFIGGVVPGLVLSALFCLYIVIRCRLQPKAGPAPPAEEWAIPWLQKIGLLRGLILPGFLIVLVLGSIFAGIATPAEAAGVGAMGAIICAAVRRQLNWRNLKLAVYGTINTVAMVMWICFAAWVFVGVFLLAGGDSFIQEILFGVRLGRWGVLIVIQLVLIILGMVMDPVGLLVLVVPIVLPVIKDLGFNPLWFGIIFNINLQIAYISPPFGYSLFYLKGVAPPDITVTDIYRSALPFMVLQIVGLALTMVFPQLALWLPGMMKR